jgi:hypothetical protein
MDKVVYFLGAGFSAPLGLPVTNNFLVKSKDIYAADSDRYAHFSEVFKTIRELSIIKNYYQADLFNIEEVLSILDMAPVVRIWAKLQRYYRLDKSRTRDSLLYHQPKLRLDT